MFEQSPVWDNWEQIDDITPPGAGNAYVFLPVAPGNYYFFATRTWPQMEYPEGLTRSERTAFRQEWKKKHPRGYHAWHSTDLKDWKLFGLVCPSSCMTTAEYADGNFYLYYDNPNDENPHLIIDLTDGVPGKEYGEVFSDLSHGSDAGVFRDEDGTFHMIYEDWSPINARANGWDSPLAGRVSSPDGIKGFKYGEHPPAVDHRTKPTGKTGRQRRIRIGAAKSVISEKLAQIRKQSRGPCHYQVRPHRAVWRSHRRQTVGRPAGRANNETHSTLWRRWLRLGSGIHSANSLTHSKARR